MTLNEIKDLLPDYAKDMRLNLGSLTNTPTLTTQQLWGTIVASAMATRHPTLIKAAIADASAHLSQDAMNAAKAAATVMGMNNIYYRFVHLVEKKDYAQMPARLRMNIIANPGVDKKDFELWSLAVSAINGCGMCITSHEGLLVKEGMDKGAIQDSIRIASILHAVATVLDCEGALCTDEATAEAA